jgi:signal transduction histidine kinase
VEATPVRAENEIALERGLLAAIAAFRWWTWAWMAVVLVIDARNDSLVHLPVATALVLAALAFTAWATVMVRTGPAVLLRPPALATELAVAGSLVFADHWAYGSAHSQSLGSAWPLAAVMSIGLVLGAPGGATAGLLLGVLRWLGELWFEPGRWSGDRTLAAWGSVVLFGLTGAVAGFAAARLRDAERRIAAARAREEVARTLHDGVLQTLAVVQRRSDDPDLVSLARDQERELRDYLFGADARPTGLGSGLRQVASRAERHHGLRAQVVLADDPRTSPATTTAVVGAVAEALTNAAKHGGAATATVYVEQDDDGTVFCSVKDDGRGFDPTSVVEGEGIRRSIRARVVEVGGRVEIDGRPDRGTEVRLWVP